MKIIAISDLHGYLPVINEENVDLLLICGDIIPLDIQNNNLLSYTWIENNFIPWCKNLLFKQKYQKIIFIAGNHDFWLEGVSPKDFRTYLFYNHNDIISRLIYLYNNSYTYKEKKIYGCPYTNMHKRWAFSENDNQKRYVLFNMIPNCDILMTHSAPNIGFVGSIIQKGLSFGDNVLQTVVMNRNIPWTFCGHIHEGDHIITKYKESNFIVNVSLLDDNYQPYFKPTVIDI